MTELREPQAEAAADQKLEVKPEVIQDLDVPDGDADHIWGGPCSASHSVDRL